jgi:dihydrofolate synthase/folylpolyglutamate synthase
MNLYTQTTNELFDLQKYAIKLGLDNITHLSEEFNNPHLKYPSLHVAGTNGKGSVSFYTAKILENCGLRVGLYTSPHLGDFRERIRINGQLIDEKYIIQFWQNIKKKVHTLKATFFDTTTLLAFKYFADSNVDISIFETGLGGRLDSTNILNPDICVITPIGYDHQKYLGETLEQIAIEKAGIIKDNAEIYVTAQKQSVLEVIKSKVKNPQKIKYLPLIYKSRIKTLNINGMEFLIEDLEQKETLTFHTPTPAEYQQHNIACAYFICKYYCSKNNISFERDKIISLISETYWPGRMQLVQKNPLVFFDVSHNIDGIKSTVTSFRKITNLKQAILLLGIVNDKDAQAIVKFLAGKFHLVVITEPDTYRKQDGEYLVRLFESAGQKILLIKDLNEAYESCIKKLNRNQVLIALGSHYLIGALMKNRK